LSNPNRARPVFIFDFGGVVIKWKNNDPIYDYVADRYGVPRKELRQVFERSLPKLESGDVSMRGYLDDALAHFGKRLRAGDSPDDLWTAPFERLARLRIGTVRLVGSLRKRGYRVFLFSNTSLPHVKFLRKVGWDKIFDGFVSSCELGSTKPDRAAYARAVREIGARPSEVIFVDDKEVNVAGAKRAGIRWAFRFTTVAQAKKDIAQVLSGARSGRGSVDPDRQPLRD
jgi:putative hydrolase of the HAD superfamily